MQKNLKKNENVEMKVKVRCENSVFQFDFLEKLIDVKNKSITLQLDGGELFVTENGLSATIIPEEITAFFHKNYHPRTLPQNNTLRMIEKYIFYVQNEYWPSKDEMYWLHEDLLEKYSVRKPNPEGKLTLVRTSDPRMNTLHMGKIINGALNELSILDIPDTIINAIGIDIKTLYRKFKEWIYRQNTEFINKMELDTSRDQKICEVTGDFSTVFDPVERMHLIAGLQSDPALYDHPRVYIFAKRSIHKVQHDKGWDNFFSFYPAIKRRHELAREFVKLIRGGVF